MPDDAIVREDATLAAVRTRGLRYLNYLFWVLAIAGLLVFAQLCAALMSKWLGAIEYTRTTLGFARPVGPDYWIIAGFAAVILVVAIVAAFGLRAYHRSWNRRLRCVWTGAVDPALARLRPLEPAADARELERRTAYLRALTATPEWKHVAAPAAAGSRAAYELTASAVLKSLEVDIAQRAVTAGLVVGLNPNPVIDATSIIAAALDLQLHVLTRLGKRPSVGVWIEMLKRTTASLFLNWYVSREDALYLKLAIKKTGWGVGAASDLAQQAADALDDVDWDEFLGGSGVPGLSLVGSLAAKGIGIGAFGLRQVGTFIESTADDLLQGVLAGGILYYHGMALAAECLSLDMRHRDSPAMTRTISQAMAMACVPAGRILNNQVRVMRDFLRDRRRMVFSAAKGKVKQRADSLFSGFRRGGPSPAQATESELLDPRP